MTLYNLFPLLAGRFENWGAHLGRAAAMNFEWVFVNPIQRPGRSGSLYSIADYYGVNPHLLDVRAGVQPDEQVRRMVDAAHRAGLKVMIDLVVNHCAVDSPLTREHPDWFARVDGRIAHPWCRDGEDVVVWYDLARFDHAHSRDAAGLYRYCRDVALHMLKLGFDGLRCDAAYQAPRAFWERLIGEVKQRFPDACLVAETLGCGLDQTRETAEAGFDFVFNSAKWWDLRAPWLIEQYDMLRDWTASIGFPESHDTPRLCAELDGNVAGLKQRYLFAALFSSGVMMPVGYEFGFRKRLHVVKSRPADWEATDIDLQPFIAQVNRIKRDFPPFHEECPTTILQHPNPNVLVMWKASKRSRHEALLVLNRSLWREEDFEVERFGHLIQSGAALRDVSPEEPLDYLPEPFHYTLAPGQGRVFVTTRT